MDVALKFVHERAPLLGKIDLGLFAPAALQGEGDVTDHPA